MSLVWIDGFDNYGDSTGTPSPSGILSRYYPRADDEIELDTGRINGYALVFNGYDGYLYTPCFNNTGEHRVIIGFAFKLQKLSRTNPLVYFRDQNGSTNCFLRVNTSGLIEFCRYSSTILGTGTTTLTLDTWYYVEIDAHISDSTDIIVKLNGSTEISLTDVDTKYSSSATCINQLSFSSASNVYNIIDDFYVLLKDSTGASDFLGPCVVETIRPNADEGTNNWTCSSGTDHSALVDEVVLDEDTTYVYTNTTDAYDIWDYTTPGTTSTTIYGISVKTDAREDSGGAASISNIVKSGTTTDAATPKNISIDSYLPTINIWEEDPDTSSAWTVTGLTSAKFGIRYTS